MIMMQRVLLLYLKFLIPHYYQIIQPYQQISSNCELLATFNYFLFPLSNIKFTVKMYKCSQKEFLFAC